MNNILWNVKNTNVCGTFKKAQTTIMSNQTTEKVLTEEFGMSAKVKEKMQYYMKQNYPTGSGTDNVEPPWSFLHKCYAK